jgi:cytochrome c biogenesis protein CcmG, thiol:disulfide interchange protein DsbE
MRRTALATALAAALTVLTACSGAHAPSLDPNKTLNVATPELAAIKQHSRIPDCPRSAADPVSDGLPSVTLDCLGGGRAVDLSGLRGPLVVNFWQSTCGPCRKEMPALAAFARSQSEVKVLGIDYLDMQPAAALNLARDSDVGYPLVSDQAGNLAGKKPLSRIVGLPFTAYVDAAGRVVHLEAVPMTSEAEVAAAAQKYLGTGG